MKKSINGNMYSLALDEAWDLFADHLDGERSALFLVLSEHPLPNGARAALESSASALGYGPPPGAVFGQPTGGCTFATLTADGVTLDPSALFLLVEGLDPLCVVAADAPSARALAETYRCDVPLGEARHVFGRPAVAFKSFAAMLADGQDKQVAWALLKRLPKRSQE